MEATLSTDREAVTATLRGLDRVALQASRWYGDKDRPIEAIELDEAFVLDEAGPHVLATATFRRAADAAGAAPHYLLACTGEPLRLSEPGDGTWLALAVAMAEGRTIASLPRDSGAGEGEASGTPGPITAALICRPGPAMVEGVAEATERALGADQSNTSVVLDETTLVKAYRRLQPGLNPELELVAYLSEEAAFSAVPPLAGYVELASARDGVTTIAIAQAFIATAVDAYETVAETLTGWLLAPGSVAVEFATEVAADLGTLTAAMHAALADANGLPGFEPRSATRDDLHAWSAAARARLDRALEVTTGDPGRLLHELAPRIVEELSVYEAVTSLPLLTRIHGDYHLGQVLIAPDGYRIIDFEGPPAGSMEERGAQRSPLRDVASMLRSFDHVGRSAGRRAEARNGGPLDDPGLDLAAWLARSRERFLATYAAGLRRAGTGLVVDPALVRGFEIEKECEEFAYASTYLPSWLWAPTEGMRGLFDGVAP